MTLGLGLGGFGTDKQAIAIQSGKCNNKKKELGAWGIHLEGAQNSDWDYQI